METIGVSVHMSATQQVVSGLPERANAREIPRSRVARLRLSAVHLGIRFFVLLYGVGVVLAKIIGPNQRPLPERIDALLTATFYSQNWIGAHLHPLAASSRCGRIWMVATSQVPAIEKVIAIYPPGLLIRCVGKVPARLLIFAWVALKRRPDVIGGFHILLNGMLAALLAKLCGSHALYICGGGPREILDGGIRGENRLFGRLVTPDAFVEKHLLRAVDEFDCVITMGRRAAAFFRDRGVKASMFQNPGGLDDRVFCPAGSEKVFDVVIAGRISRVKRIDIFLRAIAIVRQTVPEVRAVVVGDGPLRREMEVLSKELLLDETVCFAGQQTNVAPWLQSSRIFALTSDSEGVSLAMMEAMSCGLPVVVSKVGDLDEMVVPELNGFLVEERTPENFATCIARLIRDESLRDRMSVAAREKAHALGYRSAGELWDRILGALPNSAVSMGAR
jgi:glycosyltransferase involved in cell wall biosynthesis